MARILTLCCTALIFFSCSKHRTCSDFREGTFLILGDSIYKEYKTIRRDNQLIEFGEDGSEEVSYIEYIDDCTHLIQFPKDTSDLTTVVGLINAAGEIRVEVERISGDTLFYNSIFENDTFRFEQPGAMLKIK